MIHAWQRRHVHFWSCLVLIWGLASSLEAATLKVFQRPANTGDAESIFVAGSFNGWNPADPKFRLAPQADGTWAVDLPQALQGVQSFKFTRGSWATVEKNRYGQEIGNRIIDPGQDPQTKAFKIESWADRAVPEFAARSGNIVILKNFWLPEAKRNRDIWIYLPSAYARKPEDSFPVLYMYDAQNLFDDTTAAFGAEWSIDETLERLYYEGQNQGMIVVAVANSMDRPCEFNAFVEDPHPYCSGDPGLGDAFNRAIVGTLKPYIDSHYRTLSGREHSFIGGSSMGGQMALKMGLSYPEVFSKVAALSPSFQHRMDQELAMVRFIKQQTPRADLAIWQDMGDKEQIRQLGATILIRNMEAVHQALLQIGYPANHLEKRVIPGAPHNEVAWAQRFGEIANWLLADQKDEP